MKGSEAMEQDNISNAAWRLFETTGSIRAYMTYKDLIAKENPIFTPPKEGDYAAKYRRSDYQGKGHG